MKVWTGDPDKILKEFYVTVCMKDGEDYESKSFQVMVTAVVWERIQALNYSWERFWKFEVSSCGESPKTPATGKGKQLSELVSHDKKLKQPKMETEAYFACIIIT